MAVCCLDIYQKVRFVIFRCCKAGMHNIRPAGQMCPAEAFNLARETPNFAFFFDKKHSLNVLKHNNFGPWMCQKKIWAPIRFELFTPGLN